MAQLQSIQALRGIAALLVLLAHIGVIELRLLSVSTSDETPLLLQPLANGVSGVDIFFVISGFIMVYVSQSYVSSVRQSADFLIARFVRVYPIYWVFLALAAIGMFVQYGLPYDAIDIPADRATNHVISSILLIPQFDLPILVVGWTLVHELFFYLVFAVLLFAPRAQLGVWLAIWGLVVLSGSLLGLSDTGARSLIELVFSPLTLEFIGGAFVAILYLSGKRIVPIVALAVGAIGFLAGLVFNANLDRFFLEWGRVLIFGLPSLLIVYGAVCLEDHYPKNLVGRFFSTLGDWSYALYLSHLLVLLALSMILPKMSNLFDPAATGVLGNLLFALVGLIGSIIFAGLAHRFLERPLTKALNSRLRLKR